MWLLHDADVVAYGALHEYAGHDPNVPHLRGRELDVESCVSEEGLKSGSEQERPTAGSKGERAHHWSLYG